MSRPTFSPSASPYLIVVGLALFMWAFAGCGGDDGGDSEAGGVGEGEGQLDLIAWGGYVEDGSSDPAEAAFRSADSSTCWRRGSGKSLRRDAAWHSLPRSRLMRPAVAQRPELAQRPISRY